jgi:hypothetical protein
VRANCLRLSYLGYYGYMMILNKCVIPPQFHTAIAKLNFLWFLDNSYNRLDHYLKLTYYRSSKNHHLRHQQNLLPRLMMLVCLMSNLDVKDLAFIIFFFHLLQNFLLLNISNKFKNNLCDPK